MDEQQYVYKFDQRASANENVKKIIEQVRELTVKAKQDDCDLSEIRKSYSSLLVSGSRYNDKCHRSFAYDLAAATKELTILIDKKERADKKAAEKANRINPESKKFTASRFNTSGKKSSTILSVNEPGGKSY